MIVNICGIPHTVVEKEDSFDSDTHFGMINYAKCEIIINKDIPEKAKTETLCHEMIHGILIHIGKQDLASDETFVQTLGNAIFQAFDVKRMDGDQVDTYADA